MNRIKSKDSKMGTYETKKILCLALMRKFMSLIMELIRYLFVLRVNNHNLTNICQNFFWFLV